MKTYIVAEGHTIWEGGFARLPGDMISLLDEAGERLTANGAVISVAALSFTPAIESGGESTEIENAGTEESALEAEPAETGSEPAATGSGGESTEENAPEAENESTDDEQGEASPTVDDAVKAITKGAK